jgi:hypothetical protein
MLMDFRAKRIPSTEIFRRSVDLSTIDMSTRRRRTTPVTTTTTTSGRIPMSTAAASRGIGGTTLPLPAGRNVLPPSSFTSATTSVFGGTGVAPVPPTMLSGITSSFDKASVGVMNTLGTIVPLAIKVILAVIVIKIVLWLVKRR